ncbi:ribonuclease E [Nesterenkonia lacusekhoensis]|uniref:Ribonuclease E n=2 Tax=Nesterenkonia lacusekhoensis TaxID=150832 RepID=A0ABS4T0X4_9MICC|nr:Rne/Rng family ribonuclease [Nesterenkonia lacusekhoensis]MBP2318102.1 ribonuclease E [Nesterenkonia lacusekhoensis]
MTDTPTPQSSGADVFTPLFQAPDLDSVEPVRVRPAEHQEPEEHSSDDAQQTQYAEDQQSQDDGGGRKPRRKRRRGGRNKNRQDQDGQQADDSHDGAEAEASGSGASADQKQDSASSGSEAEEEQVIRKRRRRRRGSMDMELEEESDEAHTVTRVRAPREAAESDAPDKVTSLKGSTRLEAKRQRRRASREGGRKRQVITEAEFLARRESVDRKMIVRQRGERIQIGVLEDGVLAEHYVSNTTQDSLIGNVYLGKVQNVLPSMEAAFVDIGRGRNAVLYAGEVDWSAANLGGKPRKIENALKSGDPVLVQVTKDPVGHKGARLTSQVSLPGRYLVFVPGGTMTGISRKLPDTERSRLKKILKEHMPEDAGVIVRTAAEGASEEELTNDINRLRALWESIREQEQDRKVLPPELLYSEPDLTIKVVRDVFNEDFSSMEIQGDETWDSVEAYVTYVAPHLLDRLTKWETPQDGQPGDGDIFAHHRIDEQLNKALDRNVKLPSGGSLVFDRTEAMTVVDVNTGKFTGSGGNLEETVTRNNLEAAEEIVRQLRLRDIGGIIVIDFIDMVLESNRDLVLRRLVECLGRDRTKHQVAEVTSLGLVQMTRKRMGTGLLEVFSEGCEHCAGRGIITHEEPIEHRPAYNSHGEQQGGRSSKKRRKSKGGRGGGGSSENGSHSNDSSAEQSKEEREKTEKARQALAQVAAATTGKQDEAEDSGPREGAQQGSGQKQGSGSKKGSGRKQRSDSEQKSGSEHKSGGRKDHEASEQEQPVLTIGGEEVPVPRGETQGAGSGRKKAAQQADPEKAEEKLSLDSLDQVLSSRTSTAQQGSAARPPRRRRAAGASQGAAGEVQQVSAAVSGPAKTFSSTTAQVAAEEQKKQEEKPSAEPMMFGVGVKAEDISSPKRNS